MAGDHPGHDGSLLRSGNRVQCAPFQNRMDFCANGPAETRGSLKKQSVYRAPWLFVAPEPCGRRMLVSLVKYRKIYKPPYAPEEICV
jgi:hypothetical protein